MSIILKDYQLKDYDNRYFERKITIGDGDCAYNSFLSSMIELYPKVKVPKKSKTLRKALIKYINDGKYIHKKNDEIIKRIQSGIDKLGDGWGENEEFEIMSKKYNVCIAIWSAFQKLWIYVLTPDINTSKSGVDGCKKIIYLINIASSSSSIESIKNKPLKNVYNESNKNNGLHFDYLIPKKEVVVYEDKDDSNKEEEVKDSNKKDSNTDSDEEVKNSNKKDSNTDSDEEDIDSNEDDDDEEDKEDSNKDEDDSNNDPIDEDEDDDIDIETEEKEEDELSYKDEIENVKKMTVIKRFEYFKNQVENFDNFDKMSNSEEINKMLHISKHIKPVMKTHRLSHQNEYFVEIDNNKTEIDGFSFTKNQKFLKKFLSIDTSNMGLLLFHGVGVGKTCSSIVIAENFVNMFDKKVLILLPSSLENNYRKELFDMSKLNFETKSYDSCNGKKYLDMLPSWDKMSRIEINKKIQKMINEEYSFFGYLKIVNFVENLKKKSRVTYGKDEDKRKAFIYNNIRDYFSNRVIIIDEIHNIRLSDDKSLKKFPNILKLILKWSNNVRLVLLSATPMFDSPKEISWIMDFMFLVDKKYKSFDTTIEFDENNQLTESSVRTLKYFSKNYVSYMRGYNPETFPLRYYQPSKELSKSELPSKDMLTNNEILPIDTSLYTFEYSFMKAHQLKIYEDVIDNTKQDGNRDIQKKIQLSNIVYPDNNLDKNNLMKGKSGFKQTFNIEDTKLLKVSYSDDKNECFSQKNISKYSSKMDNILQHIEESEGLVLVYSKYLYSGVIPLAIALEHLGYSKYNNNNILTSSSTKNKQKNQSYIIITADDKLSPNNVNELMKFNEESNKNGEAIKVALINEIASEGVSFKHVREIHILEPWYNMNKIEQIIGRGVRYLSHHNLPSEKRNVCIYLHINLLEGEEVESVDYRRYRVAMKKQFKIGQVETIMKNNSVDCVLNNNNFKNSIFTITNSKGKAQKISTNFDAIKCAHNPVSTNKSPLNMRLLLFDIIEINKILVFIIQKNKLYSFSQSDIELLYNHALLKDTLGYMCKYKRPIVLNEIKGYLIKTNDQYFFQQEEIDDVKINLSDRKKTKQKFINHLLIADKTIKENKENISIVTNIEDGINTFIKKMKEILSKGISNVDDINDKVVMEMAIDRLTSSEMKNVFELDNIKHKDILESLHNSHIIVKEDDKVVAYFDIFMNDFFCKKNDIVKECAYKLSDTYKTNAISKLSKNKEKYGFMEVSTTKDKVLKLQVKIILRNSNKKSLGSACISTSTFTNTILKKYIEEYDKDFVLKSFSKENLCFVYEYYLRKNDLFTRPLDLLLKKKLI
jgi:hypothetical protein